MQHLLLLPALMAVAVAASGPVVINAVVEVYQDAILPCVISSDMRREIFDWKRDDGKQVFLYEKENHYNNDGVTGQDPQFKDRVEFFFNELQHGNASIKLKSAKVSDSGVYTCIHVSNRGSSPVIKVNLTVGASSKPRVKKLEETKEGVLLLCAVSDVSPKPELELQDSSNKTVQSKHRDEDETRGLYDVVIHTVVKKTDKYRCVVKQCSICHESFSDWIQVNVTDQPSPSNPWMIVSIVLIVLIVAVIIAGAIAVAIRKAIVTYRNYKRKKLLRKVNSQSKEIEEMMK